MLPFWPSDESRNMKLFPLCALYGPVSLFEAVWPRYQCRCPAKLHPHIVSPESKEHMAVSRAQPLPYREVKVARESCHFPTESISRQLWHPTGESEHAVLEDRIAELLPLLDDVTVQR